MARHRAERAPELPARAEIATELRIASRRLSVTPLQRGWARTTARDGGGGGPGGRQPSSGAEPAASASGTSPAHRRGPDRLQSRRATMTTATGRSPPRPRPAHDRVGRRRQPFARCLVAARLRRQHHRPPSRSRPNGGGEPGRGAAAAGQFLATAALRRSGAMCASRALSRSLPPGAARRPQLRRVEFAVRQRRQDARLFVRRHQFPSSSTFQFSESSLKVVSACSPALASARVQQRTQPGGNGFAGPEDAGPHGADRATHDARRSLRS